MIKPEAGEMPDGAVFISKPFSAEVVYKHLMQIMPDGAIPERLKKAATRET